MPANEYAFVTHWTVTAERDLVYEILKAGADYARWWPDVYLDARHIPSGRPGGVGDQVVLLTRGWLPYKLRWTATSVANQPPSRIEISATGDFVGKGIWELTQNGPQTEITFFWRLRADKPLIKLFSPVMKPIFRWNHRWAMDKGLIRLREEIARRVQAVHTGVTV